MTSGELFLPQTRASEPSAFALRVGPETSIIFDVVPHLLRTDIGVSYATQFLRRRDVENWPVMLPINGCADMPRAFHAGMQAFAVLVRHSMERHRVYEGDLDQTINVQAILHGWALVYNVDVNEIPRCYHLVRPWLTSRTTHTPETFDVLQALLRQKGHTGEINLKGMR